MRAVAELIIIIAVVAFVFFAGFSIVEQIEKIDDLKTRIEYLENRVGTLCVTANGKTTGFDKAIVRGG